jgi:hypothetical protein
MDEICPVHEVRRDVENVIAIGSPDPICGVDRSVHWLIFTVDNGIKDDSLERDYLIFRAEIECTGLSDI